PGGTDAAHQEYFGLPDVDIKKLADAVDIDGNAFTSADPAHAANVDSTNGSATVGFTLIITNEGLATATNVQLTSPMSGAGDLLPAREVDGGTLLHWTIDTRYGDG